MWQYRTASTSSSLEKLPANARAEKELSPKYTASHPACTAAIKASIVPAGASNSAFFIIPP